MKRALVSNGFTSRKMYAVILVYLGAILVLSGDALQSRTRRKAAQQRQEEERLWKAKEDARCCFKMWYNLDK